MSARALCLVALPAVLAGCPVAVTDSYTLEPEPQGGAAARACDDGRANGDETDVDCGGLNCDPCTSGSGCLQPRDCTTSICTDGICE